MKSAAKDHGPAPTCFPTILACLTGSAYDSDEIARGRFIYVSTIPASDIPDVVVRLKRKGYRAEVEPDPRSPHETRLRCFDLTWALS